jgi:hypothetical protein
MPFEIYKITDEDWTALFGPVPTEISPPPNPYKEDDLKFHPGVITEQFSEHLKWLRAFEAKKIALKKKRAKTPGRFDPVLLPFFQSSNSSLIPKLFARPPKQQWLILPSNRMLPDVILPLLYAGDTFKEVYNTFSTLVLLPTPSPLALTLPIGISESYYDKLLRTKQYKPFISAFETAMCLNQRLRRQMRSLLAPWLLKTHFSKANDTDFMTLEPPVQPVRMLDWRSRREYVFEAQSLFRDWIRRLTLSDYMYPTPQPLRNPFTNLPLTLGQTVSAYEQLQTYPATRHWALEAFRAAHFDLKLYARQNQDALKYYALKQTFLNKKSDEYICTMIDFIEDEHHHHRAPFNKGLYLWAIRNEPDAYRLLQWHKYCYAHQKIQIEVADAEDAMDKLEDEVSAFTGDLCSPPAELSILRDAWYKKNNMDKRKGKKQT